MRYYVTVRVKIQDGYSPLTTLIKFIPLFKLHIFHQCAYLSCLLASRFEFIQSCLFLFWFSRCLNVHLNFSWHVGFLSGIRSFCGNIASKVNYTVQNFNALTHLDLLFLDSLPPSSLITPPTSRNENTVSELNEDKLSNLPVCMKGNWEFAILDSWLRNTNIGFQVTLSDAE